MPSGLHYLRRHPWHSLIVAALILSKALKQCCGKDYSYCTEEGVCFATEKDLMDAMMELEPEDETYDEYYEEYEPYDESHCRDWDEECRGWSMNGECRNSPEYMLERCPLSCGECIGGREQAYDEDHEEEIEELIQDVLEYLRTAKDSDTVTHRMLPVCKAKYEECAYWAVLGECEANPEFMMEKCTPLCKACDYNSVERRCPWNSTTHPDAWVHGDVDRLFLNITTSPEFQQYEPTILSSPYMNSVNTDSESQAEIETDGRNQSSYAPWVLTLDKFLSQEECNRLIEFSFQGIFSRSSDVGELLEDGSHGSRISDSRTSENSWCHSECERDPTIRKVLDRITHLTNIPEANSEHLQLLKYETGQYYKTHHDFIEHDVDRPQGPRILTVYLYLSDVEEGGGTNFPELNITVQPKLGKALIWPSVSNDNFREADESTLHQALPVIKGWKFGANAWLHLRNFKSAYENGCAS